MSDSKLEYKITAFIPEVKGREVTMKLDVKEPGVIQQVISRLGGACSIRLTDEGKKQLEKQIDYAEEDHINRGY